MKVFLLDNYDSFTFNLFHYLEALGCEVTVNRNDKIDWEKVEESDRIILSPGPGLPKDAGQLMELIKRYHDRKPILGVCLGMQALGVFFGAKLYNLEEVKHGVNENCFLSDEVNSLFDGVGNNFLVGLYHSWAVDISESLCLKALAFSESEVLMAMKHETFNNYGVQFHPESILTKDGKQILNNFLAKI